MKCLIPDRQIRELSKKIKGESLSSVVNMVGVWREREGVDDGYPTEKELLELYSSVRDAQTTSVKLTKSELDELLVDGKLPEPLLDLAANLGVKVSVNKRSNTVKVSKEKADSVDMLLFRALAANLIYQKEVAERAFEMSPRESLDAILNWEKENAKKPDMMRNFARENALAKMHLRDVYEISDDGIKELLRKKAADAFTAKERQERTSEFVGLFDRIVTEKVDNVLAELASRRDALNEAIKNKDISLYRGEISDLADNETQRMRSLLGADIAETSLSDKTIERLTQNNIDTIADIVSFKNRTQLQKSLNLGTSYLKDVIRVVDEMGLSFGTDVKKYMSVDKDAIWESVESEYRKELADIQEKQASYSRRSAVLELSPMEIFLSIRKSFQDAADAESDADFVNAVASMFGLTKLGTIRKNIKWYRSQVQKVLDNFEFLCDEACRELNVSEALEINLKSNEVAFADSINQNDDESEGEDEGDVNGIENQFKENWMFEFDTKSNWSNMRSNVRLMLYKSPISKDGRKTAFGQEKHAPVMDVIKTLLREMQGVMNSKDMMQMLEVMSEQYPWAQYIIGEVSKDSKLKTDFFLEIRRYAQTIGVLRQGKEDPNLLQLKLLNRTPSTGAIRTAMEKNLLNGVPLVDDSYTAFNEDKLIRKNIARLTKLIGKYDSFDDEVGLAGEYQEVFAYIKENPSVIKDVTTLLRAFGIPTSEQEVREVVMYDVPFAYSGRGHIKNNLYNLLTKLRSAIKWMSDYDELTTIDQMFSERRSGNGGNTSLLGILRDITGVMSIYDNGSIEPSVRENGKTRYTYVLPSDLDNFILGVQGKIFKEVITYNTGRKERVNYTPQEYIIKKFGDDPYYCSKTETPSGTVYNFRNIILQRIYDGESIDVFNFINCEIKGRKVEQRNFTRNDRNKITWSLWENRSPLYEDTKGTWFPGPVGSDSGRFNYMRFDMSGVDIGRAIKEDIIKELERMVETDEQVAGMPDTYKDNRKKFCTFPVLNYEDITGISVSDIIRVYRDSINTDDTTKLDEMINSLVDTVRTAMFEKFKDENEAFVESRRSEDDVRLFVEQESVFQMAINEIVNGRAAFYTGYNTGSDNMQKRAKQYIVPKDPIDIFNEDFLALYKEIHGIDPDAELSAEEITERCMYIKDPMVSTTSYDEIKELYDDALAKGIIDEESYRIFIEGEDGISNIKHTDGQTFRSFKSMKSILYARGVMKKGDPLDMALDRIAEGRQEPSDAYVVQTAVKSFLSGTMMVDRGDGQMVVMPVQHKTAEQLLTAALAQASMSVIGKSPALRAITRVMEERGIDIVSFTSSVKVGQNGAIDFGDVDPETSTEDVIYSKIISEINNYKSRTGLDILHEVPYELYGFVSYNPDYGMETQVQIGVQMQKLLPADLPDEIITRDAAGNIISSEKAVYNVEGYGDMSRDEIIHMYNALMTRKIEREYEEVTGEMADRESLSRQLQKACRNSSRNSSYLERAFSLDEYGNFVIPLCDPATMNLSSEFLNSIIRKSVTRIRVPGKQLVSMSSFGVAKQLGVSFERNEDGSIKKITIDVLLPAFTRDIVNLCLNEDGSVNFEKFVKSDPRIRRMFVGLRVPTQFKSFTIAMNVVDFLPTILGDSIVMADLSSVMMDADFDNDKVFTFFPELEADYFIDDWKSIAKKDYDAYRDTYYDFNKLRDDFNIFLGVLKQDGIENADYTFSDFIRDRLGDEEYEPQYRRETAPEGKPQKFNDWVNDHLDDYRRKDGPKISLVDFDLNDNVKKMSEPQLNNAIVAVMHAMISSPAVATMVLSSGSTERLDPVVNELRELRQERDRRNNKKYADIFGPADIASHISQQVRNNDGKEMISVLANTTSIHALLSNTNVSLNEALAVTINGRKQTSMHDIQYDDLKYISTYIGTSLGGAADNSKKAKLSEMNFSLQTAPVVSLMLCLGYTIREISFFLNIPSIRHYTETGDFGDYSELSVDEIGTVLPGTIKDMRDAIAIGDNYKNMKSDMQAYCNKALGIYLHLYDLGTRFRTLASLTRGDSGSGSPHGPLEEALARYIRYELFEEENGGPDPVFLNWKELVNLDYNGIDKSSVDKSPNPISQAYLVYGVVGAFKELSKYFPGIDNPKFRDIVKNIIKDYFGGVASARNVKTVIYDLYHYIQSSYDCMRKDDMTMEESRDYYINYFPEEACEILARYPEVDSKLFFRKLNILPASDEKTQPFISLNYEGAMQPYVRDMFTWDWQQLFYAKNPDGTANIELRELARDMFKYCFHMNGFRFTDGSYAHLAPAEARLLLPGYNEMLEQMMSGSYDVSYENFATQLLRNNLYDYRVCKRIPFEKRKVVSYRDSKGNVKDTLKIPFLSKIDEASLTAYDVFFSGNSETPIPAFLISHKTNEGENVDLYYIKQSDNPITGESTYVLTTPLGWQGKATEYSATVDGLRMVSVYDQNDVREELKNKKKKNRQNASVSKKKTDTSDESKEEPNENTEEEFEGLPVQLLSETFVKYVYKSNPKLGEKLKLKSIYEKYKKKKASQKEDADKKKQGGKQAKKNVTFKKDTSTKNRIIDMEQKCASTLGAYTVYLSVPEGTTSMNSISAVSPSGHFVAVDFRQGAAKEVVNELWEKLKYRRSKSIVLNLTGSYINTMGRYASQKELDSYVYGIYLGLKDKGIWVSKVVSTAQPGIALASARAAMSLGYDIEIMPTLDYKVYDEETLKTVSSKDKFMANLGKKYMSEEAIQSSRLYDSSDGPIISARRDWTRSEVEKDKKTLFVFFDSPSRTSGTNKVPRGSRYTMKYRGGAKNYPNSGSAVIRGLVNAFPLSTHKEYSPFEPESSLWTDADLKLFKQTLAAEVDDIIDMFEEYKRVVLPLEDFFEDADINQERTPKLWKAASAEIERLYDAINDISERQIIEKKEEEEHDDAELPYEVDESDTLSVDEIALAAKDQTTNGNLRIIDIQRLNQKGIILYGGSGKQITYGKLFLVLPKENSSVLIDNWVKAKVYGSTGKLIKDDIMFTQGDDAKKYSLLHSKSGNMPLAVMYQITYGIQVLKASQLQKIGLTWLDANGNPIC